MRPRTLRADDLAGAAALLAAGSVLAVPTDTVYGLAAALRDPAAVARLFEVKGRPGTVPVAVLCAEADDAVALAADWPSPARALAARFWPGPLTIVVATSPDLAARVGAARGVGFRVPDDEVCRALLTRSGPLAVTSANRHGADPATTAAAVGAAFDAAEVAGILDDGPRDRAVSSVVDLTVSPAVVVREGSIPSDEILAQLR